MSPGPWGAACPKCGRSRADGAEACPRCGLTFANWAAASEAGGGPGELAALDERGAALWADLGAHWQDDARHDAFLKHCASVGRLAPAGRCYRQRLDEHPGDEIATRMQGRVVGMASAALAPSRSAAPPINRSNWFWWVVLVCALGGAAAGLFFRMF